MSPRPTPSSMRRRPACRRVARANGDALLYDAKTNTFAVVSKTGAPRTMFKPRDGANYWQQQVSREQSRSNDDKSVS